ncbi:MAG: DUF308 domain-containing protein [Candidatus Nanopelagicales bacterium]|jgi:uncharacterized membrane protein HdeD (DUF308 family)
MASMETVEVNEEGLQALSRTWGVLLFTGLLSIVIGIIVMVWPGKTVVVVAVLLAIWLVVSGIFEIIRGFGRGLSGGMRAMLFITGVLSLILGLFAFRGFRLEDSPLNAVWLLALFVGISFIFRGVSQLMQAGEYKEGRGWNIFGGIVSLLLGIILIVTPADIALLAWVFGLFAVISGILFIVSAFQVKSLAKA